MHPQFVETVMSGLATSQVLGYSKAKGRKVKGGYVGLNNYRYHFGA